MSKNERRSRRYDWQNWSAGKRRSTPKDFDLPDDHDDDELEKDFQAMPSKVKPDDQRDYPQRKSHVGELNHLKFLTGRGDMIITKIDKELPEVYMAATEVEIGDGKHVIVFNAQAGYIGLALAQVNPGSHFHLYDTDLRLQPLAARNLDTNFHLKNIDLLSSTEFQELVQKQVDTVVLNPQSHAALALIESEIRSAVAALKIGGEVFIITHKKKGAERIAALASEALGHEIELIGRGKAGHRIYRGEKTQELVEAESSLRQLINFEVKGHPFELETEPSLFSKNDLDQGTRLLLEQTDLTQFERLLDVGSGWGPIGVVAATLNPEGQVMMVDIDTRAVTVSQANAERAGVADRVQVVATTDIRDIEGGYDLVLSNPPFHEEMGTLITLFEKVRNKMVKGGRVAIVVERTYVDKFTEVLRHTFGRVEVVHHDEQIGFFILASRK